MRPLKFLIFFVIWFTIFSALFFIVPPKSVYEAYGRAFRAVSSQVFKGMGKDGFTRFCSAHSPEPGCVPQDGIAQVNRLRKGTEEADSLVVIGARKARGNYGFKRTSSHLVGYYTTALTLVLFLSTPIAWRRRIIMALIAMIPINLFIAFRVYIFLRAAFTVQQINDSSSKTVENKAYAQYTVSEFWFERLNELNNVLTMQVTVSFVGAVFTWVAVMALTGEAQKIVRRLVGDNVPEELTGESA